MGIEKRSVCDECMISFTSRGVFGGVFGGVFRSENAIMDLTTNFKSTT